MPMTFWEYLDRRAERRAAEAAARALRPLNKRMLANVIGCALISGFLGALAALFIIPIPAANEQIITYMIGQLSGFAGGIVAYHYTLTAGHRENEAKRDETANKLADVAGILANQQGGIAGEAEGARRVADAAEAEAEAVEEGKS